MRSCIMQNINKERTFLVRKFESNPRHPTAALDYTRYGISVKNPLLVKAYMKSRYRDGKHHHKFVLMDKAKTGRDSITEYYCTSESGARKWCRLLQSHYDNCMVSWIWSILWDKYTQS